MEHYWEVQLLKEVQIMSYCLYEWIEVIIIEMEYRTRFLKVGWVHALFVHVEILCVSFPHYVDTQ